MEFKNFLIKYTTISKKFIEDFHNIIKEDYFEKYYDLLIEWNEKINLTAIIDKKSVFQKHFLEKNFIRSTEPPVAKSKYPFLRGGLAAGSPAGGTAMG